MNSKSTDTKHAPDTKHVASTPPNVKPAAQAKEPMVADTNKKQADAPAAAPRTPSAEHLDQLRKGLENLEGIINTLQKSPDEVSERDQNSIDQIQATIEALRGKASAITL